MAPTIDADRPGILTHVYATTRYTVDDFSSVKPETARLLVVDAARARYSGTINPDSVSSARSNVAT
jgi:hypothetical protein